MRLSLVFTLALIVLALVPAFGCQRSEFQVQLPSGYVGHVMLYCADPAHPVSKDLLTVSPSGSAVGAPCGDMSSVPVILRDQQRIKPDTPIHWLTTGDNIPTGMEFSVR